MPGGKGLILIVGGAGGVGSITIQLARQLTELTIIATASRPDTQNWVRELGAHHVVDHRKPLAVECAALGLGAPEFVFSTTNTDQHFGEIVALIAPQGRFALIDDPPALDVMPFKRKSVSTHWELMFTRSLFETPDMGRQGELLNEVAHLVDAGKLRTTLAETFGLINAANLKRAHALLESGKSKGKIVLEGFGLGLGSVRAQWLSRLSRPAYRKAYFPSAFCLSKDCRAASKAPMGSLSQRPSGMICKSSSRPRGVSA